MKKSFVVVVCLILLCSLTLFAAEHSPVAHVQPTSNVRTPAPAAPAGLAQIYSNLGPSASNAYNSAIGFYVLGETSAFGYSQHTALPFTPSSNATVTQIRVPIQWYNDGSADVARISIYSDNSGVPGTSLIGPYTFTPPAGFSCCGLSVINISGLSVTAGTQYWVVADTPTSSNFDGLWLIKADVPITGYEQSFFPGVWFDNIGYDLGAAGAVYGTIP